MPIKSKINKLKTEEFKSTGRVPIVSQEKCMISGYSDIDLEPIHQEDLPLIVFGDHTQVKKYIDFPFFVGADGVRLLKPNQNFNVKY